MATAGSIVIDLLMKTGSFETDTKRAEKRLKDMEKTVDKWAKTVKFGALAAGGAFAAWTLSMSKSMDATLKMAQQIGTTTEALTGLRYAAQQFASVSDQTFDMSLRRMTRRIAEAADGGGAAKGALEALGLSAKELAKLTVDEQFLRISDAMSKVGDQGSKLRNTMAIFDTEGVPLVNALSQGRAEIQKYVAEAERFGVVVSTDAARAAAQFQTSLDRLKAAASGVGISFANTTLPVANTFIQRLTEAAEKTDGLLESGQKLARGKELPEWFRIGIRALTIIADTAIFAGRGILAIGASIKAVSADAEVAIRAMQKIQIHNWFSDDATQALKDALQNRNDAVAAANKSLADLFGSDFLEKTKAWDESWAKHLYGQGFTVFTTPPTGEGGGSPVDPKPTKTPKLDEGERYLKQLQERIALLGKETEAEKLLAQIQAGSLKFKTKDMELLAQRTAAQFDIATLDQAAADRLKEMQREIDLSGLLSEADKTRYEITKGLYANLAQPMKDSLVMKAEELDMTKRQIEIEKVLADLRAQQSTTQLQFMRELESFGQGNRVRELNASLAQVEDRYRSLIEQRRNSAQGLSDDELEKIRESLQIELDMVREFHDKKMELQGNWIFGATEALNNYTAVAQDVAGQVESIFTNAFGNLEDVVFDFITTGQLDLRGLLASVTEDVLRMLIRMGIQMTANAILGNTLGAAATAASAAMGAATATAWAPAAAMASLASFGANAGPATAGIMTTVGVAKGLTLAGMAHDGIDAVPKTGTWLLEKGERVMTSQTSARLDGLLERINRQTAQRSPEYAAQPPVVNVIENPQRGGETEVVRNPDGSYSTNVFVRQIRGGGDEAKVLERTYGLRRVGQ